MYKYSPSNNFFDKRKMRRPLQYLNYRYRRNLSSEIPNKARECERDSMLNETYLSRFSAVSSNCAYARLYYTSHTTDRNNLRVKEFNYFFTNFY